MSLALTDLLEHAAAIIDGEALTLRESHTLPDQPHNWGTDLAARHAYDEYKLTAMQLYTAANELRQATRP